MGIITKFFLIHLACGFGLLAFFSTKKGREGFMEKVMECNNCTREEAEEIMERNKIYIRIVVLILGGLPLIHGIYSRIKDRRV